MCISHRKPTIKEIFHSKNELVATRFGAAAELVGKGSRRRKQERHFELLESVSNRIYALRCSESEEEI